MISVEEFESVRGQLMAAAFRILGSIHDAEDAVQNTWVKASTAETGRIENPSAWLTTVLTRICLDQLRARKRRQEEPLLIEAMGSDAVEADERYLRHESVSRALMVLLDLLTPAQRAAYVLHDLFDLPFRDVAEAIGTSPESAKKHASRARQRINSSKPFTSAPKTDSATVEAFIAAAACGDIARMTALMTDDCVRVADADLVPPGMPTVVCGARAVAEETKLFADRIRASAPLRLGGALVHVIAPGGHVVAVITIDLKDGLVHRIAIDTAAAGWHQLD